MQKVQCWETNRPYGSIGIGGKHTGFNFATHGGVKPKQLHKLRKNCECCPVSLLIVSSQRLSIVTKKLKIGEVVKNCQSCQKL